MFIKGNTEGVRGGKIRAKQLKKSLGNPEAVSEFFRDLRMKRKKKRLQKIKKEKAEK